MPEHASLMEAHPFRTWPGWKAFLLPGDAERDPGFRREIERISLRGLYIIAAITAVMPLLAFVFHHLADLVEPRNVGAPSRVVILLLALAAAAFAIAKTPWGQKHGRITGLTAGVLVALMLTWSRFLTTGMPHDAVLASLVDILIVLLVAVAAVPARPMQMAAFGGIVAGGNFVSARLAESWGIVDGVSLHYYAGMDLVILLCVVLSGFNYQLLLRGYLAHNSRLQAQSKLLISESASSISRFAATLSHELNSPLGALSSALETLEAVETRRAQGIEIRHPEMTREVTRNARLSLGKLTEVIGRMQRFTNLDRAEVSSVHIEEMLRDVAAMIEPENPHHVKVELQFEDLPPVTLKPQQISAVFAHLLQNAVSASNGAEKVDVSARRNNGSIEVAFRDYGKGFSDEEMATLFEPGFRAKGGRMAAANWGLFSSRQVVREHGGDIRVSSTQGHGSTITVRLPL